MSKHVHQIATSIVINSGIHHKLSHTNETSCKINEESDIFGFSYSMSRNKNLRTSGVDYLDLIREDDNWNNDESINLMALSYGINNNCNYEFEWSQVMALTNFDYLSLKSEQGAFFAQRHIKNGEVSVEMKQYNEARKFFRLALQLDPVSVRAHIGLANTLLATGDVADAEKMAVASRALKSNSSDAAEISALLERFKSNDRTTNRFSRFSAIGGSASCTDLGSAVDKGDTFLEKLRKSLTKDSSSSIGCTSSGAILSGSRTHSSTLPSDSDSYSTCSSSSNSEDLSASTKKKKRRRESGKKEDRRKSHKDKKKNKKKHKSRKRDRREKDRNKES